MKKMALNFPAERLKKLAIARALYKTPPLLFWTNRPPPLTQKAEYDIYMKFLSLVDSKTSIFISHRLSSTKFCDRIVVLREGQIVEMGEPFRTAVAKGYYAELFNLQAQFYFDEQEHSSPQESKIYMNKIQIAIIDSGVNYNHPAFGENKPVLICDEKQTDPNTFMVTEPPYITL